MVYVLGKEPFSDESKEDFVEAVTGILSAQMIPAGDCSIETPSGLNKRAIGYIYGFIDAALRAVGEDMSDAELGVPITWQVFRKLFPGHEDQCVKFLWDQLGHDHVLMLGVMYGGQQCTDYINGKLSAPMGLARCLLEADADEIAHEVKHDSADIFILRNVGEWIILRWRDDLFPPPQGKAFGTHLATFLLCPFGTEIRGLNFSWLYCADDKRTFRVGPPLEGINATWFFKYSTLKQFDAERLASENIGFLGLPDLGAALHSELSPSVIEIRRDQRLDPFRCPGYPDDVSVTCGPGFMQPEQGAEFAGEMVWVRLMGRQSDSGFYGKLLNQPQLYDFRKGDRVGVRLIETTGASFLVCTKLNST